MYVILSWKQICWIVFDLKLRGLISVEAVRFRGHPECRWLENYCWLNVIYITITLLFRVMATGEQGLFLTSSKYMKIVQRNDLFKAFMMKPVDGEGFSHFFAGNDVDVFYILCFLYI